MLYFYTYLVRVGKVDHLLLMEGSARQPLPAWHRDCKQRGRTQQLRTQHLRTQQLRTQHLRNVGTQDSAAVLGAILSVDLECGSECGPGCGSECGSECGS